MDKGTTEVIQSWHSMKPNNSDAIFHAIKPYCLVTFELMGSCHHFASLSASSERSEGSRETKHLKKEILRWRSE